MLILVKVHCIILFFFGFKGCSISYYYIGRVSEILYLSKSADDLEICTDAAISPSNGCLLSNVSSEIDKKQLDIVQ